VKRYAVVGGDCVRLHYVAGFYGMVPADLEQACLEIVGGIERAVEDGGVFASESLDYYSYSALSQEQAMSLPHSALATFRRYRE
jgi:hypothetical protein